MPLRGIKVIEMMGLAPGPFCGALLADFGASVTVVQKIEPSPYDVMSNGKKMLSIDLKTKEGVEIFQKLCSTSDVLLDTFRPGVMEKLGLGPDILTMINSRLIYARLSGYGQSGYFLNKGGHDLNYSAMSGVLSTLSNVSITPPPLIGDFAGGSLTCALGILLAIVERTKSGKGQIIDTSMTEGAAYLASWLFRSRKLPIWVGEPGTNVLDGGAAFYGVYETKDGKYMAVAAIESQFYVKLLEGLGLPKEEYSQTDSEKCKNKFKEVFLTKSQDEWSKIFDNLDACVTPVLNIDSVDKHQCHVSRNSFYRDSIGNVVPEPSPRLSRTPAVSAGRQPLPKPGQHTIQILEELGYKKEVINDLINKGCVYTAKKSNL